MVKRQLNLKSLNPITAMKTRNIKADTFSANTDDDLTLCLELIGRNQDKLAFNSIFRYFAPRLKSFLVKAGSTDSQAEEVIQEVKKRTKLKIEIIDGRKEAKIISLNNFFVKFLSLNCSTEYIELALKL